MAQRLKDTDEKIRMVASRGPLNIVSFLMTVPEFCVAAKADPETLEQVIAKASQLCIRWLDAQIKAAGDDVEGILVLDYICGFLNEEDYLTLAHPYLKKIFDSFDILTNGTPREVAAEVTRQLDVYGSKAGLILSAGGGASPGMPKENCRAYLDALSAWNAAH